MNINISILKKKPLKWSLVGFKRTLHNDKAVLIPEVQIVQY